MSDKASSGGPSLRGPLQRSRWFLACMVISIVAAFVIGSLVGRSFVSPTQRAAAAAPPKPSQITVAVRKAVLTQTAVLRADVSDADPLTVLRPAAVDDNAAIVTGKPLKRGETVRTGTKMVEIAMRPVFAMAGQIPAFREMSPTTRGVDVEQLQTGLKSLGFSIRPDKKGLYGAGTARAVEAFYRARGAQVAWSQQVTQATGSDTSAPSTPASPGASAEANLASLDKSVETRQAIVPQGEIVFVPTLPAQVLSSAVSLGSRVPTLGALSIGSGAVQIAGTVDDATFGALKLNMQAMAESEVLEKSATLRVTGLRASAEDGGADKTGDTNTLGGARVTFRPVGSLPGDWIGQNIAVIVTIASSDQDVLIVPNSAVSTDASGRTSVTVAAAGGSPQRKVYVTLGLTTSGEQAITADAGDSLTAGDLVVLGKAGP